MTKSGILLVAAAAIVFSSGAKAAGDEGLAFAVGWCAAEADAKTRLACYDAIAAQLKAGKPQASAPAAAPPPVSQAAPPAMTPPGAAPAAPPAQVAQTPSAPPSRGSSWYDPTSWFGKDRPEVASNNPADFGGEQISKPVTPDQPAALDEITAHVVSSVFNPSGRFTVTLDNGQIWRQIDGDTSKARFNRAGGDAVTISRGLLGSYNLVVDGHEMLFKVKRLK